jgi:hypothetical protein
MIYRKPILDISWDDVDAFCQYRTPEGAYLDYKEDFPAHLEKTMSAMANTFGGLILIGVEEDDEKKPVLPIKGIPFQRGLSERVTNIILSNIVPPVFPEIQVCKNQTGTNAVIVIRIPQSHQAPHAMAGNTRVYLRTGDLNNPEELAALDQVAWLTDNRNKSVVLREQLYTQAEARYESFRNRVMPALRPTDLLPISSSLSLSACPTYPKNTFKTPPELLETPQRIQVTDYYGTTDVFPPREKLLHSGPTTIVQDGVILVSTLPRERILFTEISCFGLYFFKQLLRRVQASDGRNYLYAGELLARIDEFLDSAGKFFEEIGYWGNLDLRIGLADILEIGLHLDWPRSERDKLCGFSPDATVLFEETLLSSFLKTGKEGILLRAVQRIGWTFNLNLSCKHIESFRSAMKH